MSIFNKQIDTQLREFGFLPVATPEDFGKFRNREKLGIEGIICPIPIKYDAHDVAEFYAALCAHPSLRDIFGKSGSFWQVGIEKGDEHKLDSLPKKLANITKILTPAYERAVTGGISEVEYMSLRINATYPTELHQHLRDSRYPTVANVDGESTIIQQKDTKNEMSLPGHSIAIFLGRLWHKAASLNTLEGNQRLTIQRVRFQNLVLPYDRPN